MGLFDKFKKAFALAPEAVSVTPEPLVVYSPASGTITAVTPTKHTTVLTSDDGMEVLVHVGTDTVDMSGKGFAYLVADGDKVRAGHPLLTFSRADIKEVDHEDVVVCIVFKSVEYADVEILANCDVEAEAPFAMAKAKKTRPSLSLRAVPPSGGAAPRTSSPSRHPEHRLVRCLISPRPRPCPPAQEARPGRLRRRSGCRSSRAWRSRPVRRNPRSVRPRPPWSPRRQDR